MTDGPPLGSNATMATNLGEYTVSELAFALKRTLEDAYGFVRVRGEISGSSVPPPATAISG